MEAENRLEGRRDPIARAFCFTRNQSSQMSSVFPISEGRFICSNPAGFCSQQRGFRCFRQTLLLCVPQWTLLSSGRVCGRWGKLCGVDFIAQKSLLTWALEHLNLAKERDLPLPKESTSKISNWALWAESRRGGMS